MWYRLRAQLGIRLKLWGCALIHGRDGHLWNAWRTMVDGVEVRACVSCGWYDHRGLPFEG